MPPQKPLQVPKTLASFTSTWHSKPYDRISPLRPELSAASRTVVVTGGGTGIGKAIAKAFSLAGASTVAILGRREAKLQEAIAEIREFVAGSKTKVIYKVVDLNQADQAKQALREIVDEQKGKIDVLVPNAGDVLIPSPVADIDVDDFMQAFDYNVRLPFNTIQAFLPHAASNATILNISSGIAHMNPVPGLSAHGASKAAGIKLLDFVQVEHPEFRVVNIQPGGVDTEMSRKAGAAGHCLDDADLPGHFCVWLASPEARFLRGKYVWANWDVEELMAREEEIQSSRPLRIGLEGVPM